VALTQAGLRFFERAQHVLRQVEEAKTVAQQAQRGEVGCIDIGFVATAVCSGVLQKSLADFRRANPAIEINMRKLVPMDQIKAIMRKDSTPALPAARTNIRRGWKGSTSIASRWCWHCTPSIRWRAARPSIPQA
jgi:DNA-binding transcriptional LysR family regulator